MRINFATANGSERTNVTLPQFYNDQFNTTTLNGQTVVGVKANASAAIVPLMVPSDPLNPDSAPIPLSVGMLNDQSETNPYRAQLDLESGQILNAQALGLLTPGVGTGVNGLPITEHLPDGHDATQVRDRMIETIQSLPAQLKRSLTWDRGNEMAHHTQITLATDMAIYFCDPRSPWQRGSNENTNGLLRQYLPKRQSMAHLTQHDCNRIAQKLNRRPRKRLGYRTPEECYAG